MATLNIMAFKTIDSFTTIPRDTSIKDMLALATAENIGSTEFRNYLHLACTAMKKLAGNEDIEVLQTFIDFEIVFDEFSEHNTTKDSFREMWCGRSNEELEIHEDYTFCVLEKLLSQNKLIFIFLDFYRYFIDVDPKTSLQKESVTHSTALILTPGKNGQYAAFHFNPHGQAGIDVKQFDKYLTRWRKKTVDLDKSLDIWMIDKMISNLNTYLSERQSEVKIEYTASKSHNYVGPNLQSGDKFGICYAYPFYLFHELCMYPLSTHTLVEDRPRRRGLAKQVRRLPSYQTLLQRGDFHGVIYTGLAKIFKDFGQHYLGYRREPWDTEEAHAVGLTQSETDFNDYMEDMLEAQGTRYVRLLFCSAIRFLTQPALQTLVKPKLRK